MNSLICPISKETVNKYVVRIIGFFVAVLVSLYVYTGNVYIMLFLIYDFYIRAFTKLNYSPLAQLSKYIVKKFNIGFEKIDKAPKIFAARVGFLFSTSAVLLYFQNPVASIVVSLILVFFALLESLFNFCVGCVVYTYIVLPLNKK